MKSLLAFMKKDWLEQLRSGKLLLLLIIFVLLGIMNPAIAKLTPWLMETLSAELAENGMTVTAVEVDALTSWTQFFKNVPMGLIVFVLLESGIFTKEFESGTLVLSLTKGLERYKVVLSKTAVLIILWSACFWLCFGITYAYNAYFWDNSIAQSLGFAAGCWWLAGLWTLSLTVLFSTLGKTSTAVLAGTGGTYLGVYLLSLLPKLHKFAPTSLTEGKALIYGAAGRENLSSAIAVAVITLILCLATSIPVFNRKQL